MYLLQQIKISEREWLLPVFKQKCYVFQRMEKAASTLVTFLNSCIISAVYEFFFKWFSGAT